MENSAMSLDTSSYYVDPMNYQMEDFASFFNNYGRSNNSSLGWINHSPYGFAASVENFFTGSRDKALAEYNRQKELKDRAYEEAQLNAARRYQEYLESSKYQRTSEDLKAAGYNPWVALQNNLGQANVSASPAVQRHNSRYLDKPSNKSDMNAFTNIVTTAIRVAALIALA